MTTEELSKQVAQEAAEVAAAPRVDSLPALGRCHFCGAITRDLRFVERVGEPPNVIERYKGVDCCGG